MRHTTPPNHHQHTRVTGCPAATPDRYIRYTRSLLTRAQGTQQHFEHSRARKLSCPAAVGHCSRAPAVNKGIHILYNPPPPPLPPATWGHEDGWQRCPRDFRLQPCNGGLQRAHLVSIFPPQVQLRGSEGRVTQSLTPWLTIYTTAAWTSTDLCPSCCAPRPPLTSPALPSWLGLVGSVDRILRCCTLFFWKQEVF